MSAAGLLSLGDSGGLLVLGLPETGLLAAGLDLGGDGLLANSLGLGLEDVLHQHTLVLEDVTLALVVELAVEVLVNLGGLAVLAEEAAENAHAADPDNFAGETGIAGTTALTSTGVATLALGLQALDDAGAGVNSVGLADHVAILDQLANGLA